MKLRMPFRTIRAQLALLFLLVAAGPLLLFGFLAFRNRVDTIKAQAFEKLTSARDLKIRRIDAWIDDMSADLETISANTRTILLPHGTLPLETSGTALAEARAYLVASTRFRPRISELAVLDGATGRVLVATTGRLEGEDRSDSPSFSEPVRTRRLFIDDVHDSPLSGRPRMTFSVPVLSEGTEARAAAVVVADVDLKLFDEILNDRSGLGETGETLVVNRDAVTLNDVRWKPASRLRLQIRAAPAILASQGKTGIIEAPDYRGVPVLAAYGPVSRMRWGFVAKQDQAELYEPVARLERTLLVLVPACLAAVGLLSVLVAGTFSRPLVAMRLAAEAFGRGDLAARNRVAREDELGALAGAFNAMAESVEKENAVATGNRDVVAAMVEPTTVAQFCRDLLPVVVRVTRSDMGAFYLPTDDGKLVAASSVGLSPAALEPFDLARLEGALGQAVASGKVTHLRDVPEGTRFTFRTVAGTAVPREMLTVPVVARERLVAVLALASLREYPPEALVIVDKSLAAFGIGFSNILAGEETRALAGELSARNAELTAQGAELSAQAQELSRQSEMLRDQNLELEAQSARVAEASRMKSEFLSSMSHELRTPLNSVLALARVLRMQAGDRLTAEETGYLEIIERNGRQLLSLINDVLDLARIESGRADVQLEQVVVAERIHAVTEGLEHVCREKRIGLTVEVEDGLPSLVTDAKRFHQVLQNVIGNAVKFTPAGRVTVTARRDGADLEVVVADTGIGIPEKDLPHIFEEFRQVDGTTSRSFEGSGLGLAIASRSVHLLGGRIGVKSAPGSGSTFTITIPFSPAAPRDPATQPAAPAAWTKDGRRTVLVVDDDPGDAALVTAQLEREGYATLVAHDGRDALRLARVHRPFAITLDVLMPEMDGWEVLQALKASPETSAIPVIVVSIAPDRGTGLALGAVGVVAKPVDPAALVAELSRVAPAPAEILVVDDDEMDRRRMAGILESAGYAVRLAASGPQAFALAADRVPDAITLDLAMPGMSGFEVLDGLRSEARTRRVPAIVVTARDLSVSERELLRGKAAAVLEKSRLSAGDLLAELGGILARIGHAAKGPDSTAIGTRGGRRRLLLVEDSEPAILQIRMVLEAEGYVVDVARGGREALERMRTNPPDGIVLDLMMPQVDGFTVLERMRGTPGTAHTPVLILTAKDLTREELGRLSANHVHQLIRKGDVDRDELVAAAARLLGREEPGRRPAPVPEAAAAPPRTPRRRSTAGRAAKVLAIEDNPDNMATLRAILGERCVLLEAANGEDGIVAARAERPALILLDMSLPGLDGRGVVARLRADDATRDVPVIALTAHAMKGDREAFLASGCDGYLAKPIDVEGLIAIVEEWTGPRQGPAGG